MTAPRPLPPRPSLESLRKQAKKLARERSVSLRDAQLVLAREYGCAGWQDLIAEVSTRLGKGLDWAAAQARRVIHDNDVEGLKKLLAEYPALLSWPGGDGSGLLGFATGAYGDAGDPERERWFTRAACAELLIDAGAAVMPSVCEGILTARARGLLQLFQRKGLLPHTLRFFAALGDLDAVRAALDEQRHDPAAVNEAFVRACVFDHEAVASLLLEQSIALDPELGERVDARVGRLAFIKYFIETRPEIVREIGGQAITLGLWKAFVMKQASQAAQDGDVTAFVSTFQREPWLLGDAYAEFQAGLIGAATLNDRLEVITAFLGLDPALLRRHVSPEFHPVAIAFTYAKIRLVPLLTRVWPLPDDLPHAAGMGDLARVKRWFDESGAPALGDLDKHFPCNDLHTRKHDDLQWGAPTAQHVLDTALAWAVINRHFDVADFLLAHGANINTNWNSHEPASILHHLVFLPNSYESMQFLIDRGIDLAIKDYRWNSTAHGWALYALNDQKMADWLKEAERRRDEQIPSSETR